MQRGDLDLRRNERRLLPGRELEPNVEALRCEGGADGDSAEAEQAVQVGDDEARRAAGEPAALVRDGAMVEDAVALAADGIDDDEALASLDHPRRLGAPMQILDVEIPADV